MTFSRVSSPLFRVGLFATLLGMAPVVTFAHTRWFLDENVVPYVTHESTPLYLFVLACVALCIVGIGFALERRNLLSFSFLYPRASHAFTRASATFSMVAGTFFMIAGTHEYLFSPNLSAESGVSMLLIMGQFVIGLMFLLGIFARVGALLLASIWMLGLIVIGVEPMLEDVWVLSTALFILIMGNDYFSIISVRAIEPYVRKWRSYALPLLRVGTGATLLFLGFSEKILRPEFGIHFLKDHPWNFMQLLGFTGYSDYLFVLSAGAVESLFGLVFILGIMTRLNALVVAIFFSIPLFLLGPIELAGHVPHFAAVIMILLFGSGEHLKIIHARARGALYRV